MLLLTQNQLNSLYHYTSEAGEAGILNSGVLWSSLAEIRDAVHGSGQYFTDIAPEMIGARSLRRMEPEQIQAGQLSLGQLAKRLFGQP